MLDFIFVVLVYRKTKDLIDFFLVNHVPNSQIIVVNSYFDDASEREMRKIAENNNAVFISVPNKGYGYGNNAGCEYALNNYRFRYLVISNPDIVIEDLHTGKLAPYEGCIIAPHIRALSNKIQNPNLPCNDRFLSWMRYELYKGNHKKLIFLSSVISRLEREFYLKIVYPLLGNNRIYSAHGSFTIIPFEVLKELHPIYNEDSFLYFEEEHLAQLALKKSIKTVYAPEIRVLHKEHSTTSALDNKFDILKQSYIIFYEYWHRKNG